MDIEKLKSENIEIETVGNNTTLMLTDEQLNEKYVNGEVRIVTPTNIICLIMQQIK